MSEKGRQSVLQRYWLRVAAVMSLAALTACAEGATSEGYWTEFRRTAQEAVASLSQPDFKPIPATRQRIENWLPDTNVIEVKVPGRELIDYPTFEEERRDPEPGLLSIYRSSDQVLVVLRNGVVVTTRGTTGDMLNYSVPIREGQQGPAMSGERRMLIQGLDNKAVGVYLNCSLQNLGPERIVVYDFVYSTTRYSETCSWFSYDLDQEGEITNEYWIGGDTIWRSTQWLGPTLGYAQIQQVKKR